MSIAELLNQINNLTLNEKLILVEKIINNIIRHNYEQQMSLAAVQLETEYKSNEDLTSFSNFYY